MQVNGSKLSIEKLKGQIDRHRTQRALADMGKGLSNAEQELEPDNKEMLLHEQVEEVRVLKDLRQPCISALCYP